MKDIKCPSCGKTFRIDPSSFEEILLQIKDEEFNKQIKERLILAEEDNKKAMEILKSELEIKLIEQNRIKESEIQTLESQLKIAEEQKINALNDLKNQATNKINLLNNELNKLKDEIKNQSLIAELSLKNKVNDAVTKLEKEKSSLTNSIEKMKLEHSINEKLIEEKFKSKISERDLTIQELREMKSRLSTKMIGETLEIHCETQFNLNRASAFKNSYFEKDNDATSGSKGDYIFREFDENKTEVVSIMFEMKNESLNGTNKRKNEDFLKELDKDRRYLVSCEGAFSYLTNDYGLEEVYLWPVNAESQITPKRMARTIQLVKEKNVPSVFCESTVSNESQMVVANETGANFGGNLFVDSLSDDSGPASSYIKMLEHNLDLIKKGLF